MYKRSKIIYLVIFCLLFLTSCIQAPDRNAEKWQKIVDSSMNTEVNIVYSSDLDFERWITNSLAPRLMDKNGIRLTCEKNKLDRILPTKDEIIAKTSNGRYDVILISKDDYEKLNKEGVLYPNFTKKLPNYVKYIEHNDFADSYIGLNNVENDAVCFYQTQLSFFYNSELMPSPPNNLDQLMDYAKENPGTLLFPHPESEEGKAFVQSVILSYTDIVEFMEKDLSKKDLLKHVLPAFRYLKELRKYCYASGSIMPKEVEVIDELFLDEEVHIALSIEPFKGNDKLMEMEYPDYTRSFNPLNAIAATSEYYAIIPVNANNKSGAMYFLNEFLSIEMQKSLFSDKNLHGMMVYSRSKADKKLLQELDEGFEKNTVSKPSVFLSKKTGEIPEQYWDIILDEWKKMR